MRCQAPIGQRRWTEGAAAATKQREQWHPSEGTQESSMLNIFPPSITAC